MIGLVIFLCIFIGVLVIGHWFLYFSIMRFFEITQTRIKRSLMIIFIIGSVSFVPSMILARAYENIFTGSLYAISGLWLAFGWHMIMACCVMWMMIGMARWRDISLHQAKIATTLIICTCIWSLYGIWCAYNPRIVHVTVQIDDLPKEWQDKTVVQLSDVHMGHMYGVGFLTRIVQTVNDLDPDVVVITGDLFDGMDQKLDHMIAPLNTLNAPDGIYAITGNHETYIGVERVYAALQTTTITNLNDAVTHIDGMQIVGISYPERGVEKNIAHTLENVNTYDPQKPTILLYHSPDAYRSAKDAGIDLQLSGHTHRGQLFPFQFITHAIYGHPYYGLTTIDDFSIYTSGGVGTWGPVMRTSGRTEIVVVHFK